MLDASDSGGALQSGSAVDHADRPYRVVPTSQLNHLANQSLFGCVAERYVFVHCRARVSRAVSCLLFVCDLSVVFVRSSVAAEQEVIHPCVVYMCECECIRVLHKNLIALRLSDSAHKCFKHSKALAQHPKKRFVLQRTEAKENWKRH